MGGAADRILRIGVKVDAPACAELRCSALPGLQSDCVARTRLHYRENRWSVYSSLAGSFFAPIDISNGSLTAPAAEHTSNLHVISSAEVWKR